MKDETVHFQRTTFIIIAIIIIFISIFAADALRIRSVQQKLEEKKQLLGRIKEENSLLRRELELLEKRDPRYVEELAHEELSLGKANEVIYLFNEYSSKHRK